MIGALMAVQTGLGLVQTISGMAKDKQNIPDYKVAGEFRENVGQAESMALGGIGGAEKDYFEQNIERIGADALSKSGSRKGGLGLVANIAQQKSDKYTQFLSMDEQRRVENQKIAMNARQTLGLEKNKKWQADLDKIMYEEGERKEMIGAGMQNMMGGLGSAAGYSQMTGQTFGEMLGITEEGKAARAQNRFDRTPEGKENKFWGIS